MTDDILRAKLEVLASEADEWDGPARVVLAGGGPEAVIAKLLDEVEDTVLSARLTFRRGDAEVALVAGGRRLQGIADASADLPIGDLRDRSLDAEDSAAIGLCGELLRAFANAESGPVTVMTAPSTRMGGDTEAGLSVRRLAEAWDLTPLDPSIPPMGHFIARLGQTVTAGMFVRGMEVVEQVGEDGHGSALDKVFAVTSDAGPTLRLWLTEDQGVALAVQKQDKVALLFPAEAVGDIQASWARVSTSF